MVHEWFHRWYDWLPYEQKVQLDSIARQQAPDRPPHEWFAEQGELWFNQNRPDMGAVSRFFHKAAQVFDRIVARVTGREGPQQANPSANPVFQRAYSEQVTGTPDERNLMDTGIQLGRRFRALKLWMTLRDLGAQGIQDVLTHHLDLAQRFAGWIDAHPDFERVAPVPFSVVCFRAHPAGISDGPALDALNERLLNEVNASGEVFLSHTRLHGAFVLRLAIGHLRTTDVHVSHAWEILQRSLAGQTGLLPR
jgi:hypothetical protein